MTNLNPINGINFFNPLPKLNSPALQNETAAQGEGGLQNTSGRAAESAQSLNLSQVYNYTVAKMDNEIVLKYLQNLLQLPDSIEKFVAQAKSGAPDSKLLKILAENLVNTKALNQFLNENSKIAADKILQVISNSLKSGIQDTAQLREIFSILSSIQIQTAQDSNSLKEFLLLYIPLNYQIFDRTPQASFASEEEEKKAKNSELSILFQTVNFSNVLCALNSENNNIYIDLFANSSFPHLSFKKIVEEFARNANIKPSFEFRSVKRDDFENITSGNFKIISKSTISQDVLILAHLIIKTVFRLDEDFDKM